MSQSKFDIDCSGSVSASKLGSRDEVVVINVVMQTLSEGVDRELAQAFFFLNPNLYSAHVPMDTEAITYSVLQSKCVIVGACVGTAKAGIEGEIERVILQVRRDNSIRFGYRYYCR
jgi:hypothetical protein